MSAWKTIYLHEFPDRNLNNFHSCEGNLQTSQNPPLVLEDSNRNYSVQIQQNLRWQDFRPATPFNDVIGIACKCILRIPHISRQSFRPPEELPVWLEEIVLMDLGHFKLKMTFDTFQTGKRIEVFMGNNIKTGLIEFPTSDTDFFEIELRWLPNGQLRVWLNKTLLVFRNDFAPNVRTSVGSVLFGKQSAALDPQFTPITYEFRYLKVKVLQESNALKELIRELPTAKCAPEIPKACIRSFQRQQVMVSNELRNFMKLFSQKHTSNWVSGDATAPISSIAKTAHLKAQKLGMALFRVLDIPNADHAAKFLQSLKDFLQVLKENLPGEYAKMVCRLNNFSNEESSECQGFRDAYLQQLDLKSRFIYDLLEEANQLIQSLNQNHYEQNR